MNVATTRRSIVAIDSIKLHFMCILSSALLSCIASCLVYIGHVTTRSVSNISIANNSFHPAAVAAPLVVCTVFWNPASRIVTMTFFFFSLFIAHLHFHVYLCECRDTKRAIGRPMEDWGPPLPMGTIIRKNTVFTLIVFSISFTALFYMYSSNFVALFCMNVILNVSSTMLLTMINKMAKTEASRGLKLDVYFGIIAKVLFFSRVNSITAETFWIMSTLQIVCDLLTPRIARLATWNRKTSKVVSPEIPKVDVEDTITIPDANNESNPTGSASPHSANLEVQPEPAKLKNLSSMNLAIATVVDKTLDMFESDYVSERNDYIFNCYKATFAAMLWNVIIKSSDPDFPILAPTMLWKMAAFLGLEIFFQFVATILDVVIGFPIKSFRPLHANFLRYHPFALASIGMWFIAGEHRLCIIHAEEVRRRGAYLAVESVAQSIGVPVDSALALSYSVIISSLLGLNLYVSDLIATNLAGSMIGSGVLNAAAVAVVIRIMYLDVYRAGLEGLWNHLKWCSSIIIAVSISSLLLSTAFLNPASRIIMIITDFIVSLIGNLYFHIYVCQCRDTTTVLGRPKEEWGPPTPLRQAISA
ncbi:hypothetical protein HDU97_002422, partial [Phlyctochytrium planicorne]